MKLLYIFVLLSLFMACSDFLDRKPLGNAVEGDLKSVDGGADGKIFGLYGLLYEEGIADLPFALMTGIRSDDAVKGYREGNTAIYEEVGDSYKYNTGDDWLVPLFWDAHYKLINRCNDALFYIDSLKLNTDKSRINVGEAKFLRGYSCFELVRAFGEVPKIDFKIKNIGDINKSKSSVEEMYNFMEDDFKTAVTLLPLQWPKTYAGRLTQGAAYALLAKVQLYRKNYGGALFSCEAVISSNKYALYPSYADFFLEKGENSSESIFEVQNYVNAAGSISKSNRMAEQTGIRGAGHFNQGWGWNQPSQNLADAYEAGDPRKSATILERGKQDGYGEWLPADLQLPYWNRKMYVAYNRLVEIGWYQPGFLNIRILRYADVLLMAAEAANELGQPAKALIYLNQIRARARAGANVLPDITTTDQGQLRQAIKQERRIEMAMEYERFYDLVRWGDAEAVLGRMGYTTRCRYMPIPQRVLDRSQGIIKQNPEW